MQKNETAPFFVALRYYLKYFTEHKKRQQTFNYTNIHEYAHKYSYALL